VIAKINLPYLILITSSAALGGLLFGFDIAIITGAGPFLLQYFHLGDLGLGWAFSSLLFGAVLGSVAAGGFTDRYGRKRILLGVAILFAVTSVATALATSFSGFLAARFVGGLAVGAVSLLSPMYVAEVSPPSVRGRMGTLYQMSIILGILISFSIDYFLRNSGTANWRWMFLAGTIPSTAFFISMSVAPETPRYLLMKGKSEEAFAILKRISDEPNAEFEMSNILAPIYRNGNDWRGLLRPGVRRALLVSFCLAILIHVSGINTIIDYSPAIFRSAGWRIDGALLSTLIVGLTEFVFTIVSFWLIDRLGRKPLYIAGSLGMCAALISLLIAVVTGHFHGPIVLVLVLIYLAFFSSCIGPVFWTLVPEIFPTDIRGVAMIIPVLTQWVANALVVLFFPFAFNQIGKAVTFGILAVMALTQAVFTWSFLPETRNRPLEEIENFWIR
jgi:MFS transporter, SP family, arabinose:H+ symporter